METMSWNPLDWNIWSLDSLRLENWGWRGCICFVLLFLLLLLYEKYTTTKKNEIAARRKHFSAIVDIIIGNYLYVYGIRPESIFCDYCSDKDTFDLENSIFYGNPAKKNDDGEYDWTFPNYCAYFYVQKVRQLYIEKLSKRAKKQYMFDVSTLSSLVSEFDIFFDDKEHEKDRSLCELTVINNLLEQNLIKKVGELYMSTVLKEDPKIVSEGITINVD